MPVRKEELSVNSWHAHRSIYRTWLSSWLIIALAMGLAPQPAYRWTGMHIGAVPAAATPPTCTGFHDFLVDQGRVLLQGMQTFDRLCILNGARDIARGDLTLHVGLLYVALGGAIVAEHQYEHICIAPGGALTGRGTLTLIAQTIAIAPGGRLTADGRSPLPFHGRDTGRYERHGACTADHAPVHRWSLCLA